MSTWKTELNNDCNDVKEILLINKLTSDHKLNATEVNSKSPCNSRFHGPVFIKPLKLRFS